MSTHTTARYLKAVGGLLIGLGLVHLTATPFIPELLRGSPLVVYNRAVGPMLLNHVLVGILLVPLGVTTWLAAVASECGELWALRILVTNTIVMFTLPLSIAAFMRQPEYYTAPLFLAGVLLAFVISLLMAIATVSLARRRWRNRRS
jgi:hypothetical protein